VSVRKVRADRREDECRRQPRLECAACLQRC
jgi:hypothetical protein